MLWTIITDTVEAEFIRLMLGTAPGFFVFLSLFCHCWHTRSMPSAFDLAKIVAVYEERGDPSDIDNSRPIALLETCYTLYETLILNRLNKGTGYTIHLYQFGVKSKLQVDNVVFSI